MVAIVAVAENWGIGKDGDLLFSLRQDMRRFRTLTSYMTVIMGRKTLESLPGGKPLPNRVNVVISRGDVATEGVIVCHSPEEAAEFTKQYPRVMVIGGGSIYRQMLPYCDTAYITKVHATPASDTFFPNLDEDPQWMLSQVLLSGEEDGIGYEMCLYRRK